MGILRGLVAVLVAALGLSQAGSAGAVSLPLDEVIAAGGFTTDNGLAFGDFQAVFSGDLGVLSEEDLVIVVLEDGFRLTGPFSAADGEIGDVLLSYTVTAESQANAIIGVSLLSNNVAAGIGAQAAVDELVVTSDDGQVVLSTFSTGGGEGGTFFDEADIAASLMLRVDKDILVDSTLLGGELGGSARISLIEQRFGVVPEPGTLVLLGTGLAALGACARTRTGQAA